MNEDHSQHDAETKANIINNIEKYGCHLALIEADNYLPGFVYTIGLYKNYGHPEIMCFGLNTDLMATILNQVHDIVKNGDATMANKLYDQYLQGYNVQFINVDKEFYPNYLGYAAWFYKNTFDFPVLQLIWPDKQHLFPWEEGFNPDWKFKQPLLDRDTNFKFYEEKNLAVFTTKQAFEGDPILYVYHSLDGDWQFHTSNQPNLGDAKLVGLSTITKLDASINNIYHLQYGWNAWRSSPGDDWEYAEGNFDEDND